MNFNEFINEILGKSVDVDGFPVGQPYQCVDIIKYFFKKYNNANINCSPSGYAKSLAENKKNNGILNYCTETTVDNMITGTIVVWGNCKIAPYSHVGFFIKDNGNGTFKCLQQNAPYPYVVISNIRYDGIIGAFIPNQLLNKKEESKQDSKSQEISSNYKCIGNMYVRTGPSVNYGVKLVKQLTKNGQENATTTNPNSYAVYKAGTIFTARKIIDNGNGIWAETPSGYVCITGKSGTKYCDKV